MQIKNVKLNKALLAKVAAAGAGLLVSGIASATAAGTTADLTAVMTLPDVSAKVIAMGVVGLLAAVGMAAYRIMKRATGSI